MSRLHIRYCAKGSNISRKFRFLFMAPLKCWRSTEGSTASLRHRMIQAWSLKAFSGIPGKALCIFFLILPLIGQAAENEEDGANRVDVIKPNLAGWSPAIRPYGKEILEGLLAQTEEKYGPYKLEYYTDRLTAIMGEYEVSRGNKINLEFTPVPNPKNRRNTVSQIQIPLFSGLLGLRSIIVPKTDLKKYDNTVSLDNFHSYIAGQGKGWADVKIYNHAKMRVVESSMYDHLFSHLVSKRYHYLPLSIIEVEEALREKKEFVEQLTIAPNIYIYYPIPVYISMTKSQTGLAERVGYGLEKLIEAGELNRILLKHLSRYIESIHADKATLFYMENPSVSNSDNKRMIAEIKSKYFSNKTRMFDLNSL